MRSSFNTLFPELRTIANKFDEESIRLKKKLLLQFLTIKLPLSKKLIAYQDLLLFLAAHPADASTLSLTFQLMQQLSEKLKEASGRSEFDNSGLPFSKTISTFSHDLLHWLKCDKNIKLRFDSFYNATATLNDVLQFTLPSIEKENTTLELNNTRLLKELKVDKKNRLNFLLSEFDKLNAQPFIKDHLFNSLGMYVTILPQKNNFSKLYNRLPFSKTFFQPEIIRQFDQKQLFNSKLPAPKKLSEIEFQTTVEVIKNSLTLLQRETDPVTYMDKRSFRLYELERGIAVAIFEITPDRQLPLESYVGYTLFKNGYPAAYGGSWILGKRALFGINVFEQFRGGESGFVLCQLLRVYRQVFSIEYFEVEPYQYGKDNPEGISSGAYWFYFRFGFRSLDKELFELSVKEFEKIKTVKGYRSSKETLIRFTKSNIALRITDRTPLSPSEIRSGIAKHIAEEYQGDRLKAEQAVVKKFKDACGKIPVLDVHQRKAMVDMAFFAASMKMKTPVAMKQMLLAAMEKPKDLYEYQKRMRKILG